MESSKPIPKGQIANFVSDATIQELTKFLKLDGYVGTAKTLKDLIVASTTGITGISINPTSAAPSGTGIASFTATQAGTYTNYGGVVVAANSFAIISRSATGVFSISQTALDLTSYAKLSDLEKSYSFDNYTNASLTLVNSKVNLDGTFGVATTISRSGYIDIKENVAFIKVTGYALDLNIVNFYDVNKVWISGGGYSLNSAVIDARITVPLTAKFVIFQNSNVSTNTALSSKIYFPLTLLEITEKTETTINNKLLIYAKLSDLEKSYSFDNYTNASLTLVNSKVNLDGTFGTTTAINRSGYIDIKENVAFIKITGYALDLNIVNFYDVNKVWISGGGYSLNSAVIDARVTVPLTAKFVIFQNSNVSTNTALSSKIYFPLTLLEITAKTETTINNKLIPYAKLSEIEKSYSFDNYTNASLTLVNSKVNLDGTFGTTTAINRSGYIDIKENVAFIKVTGYALDLNIVNFYDVNKVWISGGGYSLNSAVIDARITVPLTAKFVIFQNSNVSTNTALSSKIYFPLSLLEITAKTETLIGSNQNRLFQPNSLVFSSRKINLNGTITTTTAISTTDFIKISKPDLTLIKITGYALDLNIVNFYDVNKVWISGGGYSLNSAVIDVIVAVPLTTEYVVFQSLNNGVVKPLESYILNSSDYKYINDTINEKNSESFFEKAVMINDGFNQTSASAVEMVLDPVTGLAFSVYLSSFKTYGEQRERISLTIHSIVDPTKTLNYNVAVHNEVSGSITLKNPYEPNVLLLPNQVVRVTFYDDSKINYYRDFNYATKTFDSVKIIKFKDFNNSIVDLTNLVAKQYLIDSGKPTFSFNHGAIITSRLVKYNGKIYGAITSLDTYSILFYSDDNMANLIPFAIVNEVISYECSFDFIGSDIHLMYRKTDGIRYMKSTDMGVSFSTPILLNNSTASRFQIMKYNNSLLIGYNVKTSFTSNFPSISSGDRSEVVFKYGTAVNPNDNLTVFNRFNKYGIVYFYWLNIKTDLYMGYSDSQIAFQFLNGGSNNLEGKDSLKFIKIGDLTE